MDNNFYQKYYKYKSKYLILQNGGSKPYLTITDDILGSVDTIKPIGMIKKILENNNINSTILTAIDIGCGHGNLTLGLSFYFKKVYGFDISKEMLKESNINKKRLIKLRSDFQPSNVEFKKGSFSDKLGITANVIILQNSIHYADSNDIENILLNLLNHLEKNGIIIIIEPDINSKFGLSELNKKGKARKKKLDKILAIKQKIHEFVNKPSTLFTLKDFSQKYDSKVLYKIGYTIVIQKN